MNDIAKKKEVNNVFTLVLGWNNMFTNKKWFSFLEMLIVIMIVSILFISFRSAFQVKNKDVLYGQACIETIYGQVNNFLYAWLSSKSVFNGTTEIFPNQYIINFDPSNKKIELKYTTGETSTDILYSTIEMTGNMNNNYCITNSYIIVLSWDNYQLHINKGLQENSALQSFYLSGNSLVNTGESIFWQCTIQWTWCKEMARFESDIRTLQLKKYICLRFEETGECSEWDN